jgi:ATP-binding cassette, subfamily B, heavy metal transporter
MYALPSYSTIALIRDVWRFTRPYKLRFWLATGLRVIADLAHLYFAIAIAGLITFLTVYEPGVSLMPLWWLGGTFAAAVLMNNTFREMAKNIGYQISERAALDAQVATLQHLCRLDLSWHERENAGNKMKRMQKGGEGLDRILRIWITNAIELCINFIAIPFILALFDITVALLMIGFVCLYYLLSLRITQRASALSHTVNVEEEHLSGIAFEAINNMRSVKVLGMAQPLVARVEQQRETVFFWIRKRIFWFRMRDGVLSNYAYLFHIGMLFFIGWGIMSGTKEIGLLILFIEYFHKMWENIEELSMVTLDFIVAKYGVSRMTDMLDEPVQIDTEQGKLDFPAIWDRIEVRDVTFGYADDRDVLSHISFTVQRGEKIGIVGISGVGKSTLFKLLLKEHENYEGEIVIGDVPLRAISRTSFFRHSAVVLQDTEVFNFSLRDNITLANPDRADDAALIAHAVETAHVTDFLDRLPDGLNTFIGEKGVKLSGGEKQRVGIARAIFKQPDLLFLDEATSHLDLESEEKIRDSLHRFFREDVTAIVIAHRLSTIKEMDRILVLEDGRIIEEGTFAQLHGKKGRFNELWEKQKL